MLRRGTGRLAVMGLAALAMSAAALVAPGALVGAGAAATTSTAARATAASPASAASPTSAASGEPATTAGCDHPTLILTAMPVELSPLVAAAKLVPSETVHDGGRVFYVGTLEGTPVVMAMTRIAVANAEQTATDAFKSFHCSFRAVVFDGVAGSDYDIGDVAIPARWTLDNGTTWLTPDARMYKVASSLAGPDKVKLTQTLSSGDAACACEGSSVTTPVVLPSKTQVRLGGVGETTDPFGGYAIPCVPGGGDITGCEPCVLQGDPVYDAQDFANRTPAVLTPGFFEALFNPASASSETNVAASDNETAAVATVAKRFHVPFLGIRAVSDGAGDPLHLPGFPAEFFVYAQLAAQNAAATTLAFLHDWVAAGRPVA